MATPQGQIDSNRHPKQFLSNEEIVKPARHCRFLPWSAGAVTGLSVFIVLSISGLTLAGWILDITFLKSINPLWNSMKVITAICLAISAAALAGIKWQASIKWRATAARLFGASVTLMGLLSFGTYMLELATGKVSSLATTPILSFFLAPSDRMAAITAMIFVLVGSAVLLLATGIQWAADASHWMLLPASLMSYLILVGYLLGIDALHDWLNVSVALHTGIAFCVLCIGLFCVRGDTRLMRVFTGNEAGAIMARRLLPAILIIPLVIGWLRLFGERSGAFKSEVGVALVAVANTVCLLWLVWLSARSVNRTDERRRNSEQALRESDERFRLLFQQAAVGIKRIDLQGRILEINDKLCDILGYPREELRKLTLEDITHPEDLSLEKTELSRLLSKEIPNYSIEKRCLRRDGSVIWVRVSSSLPAGNPTEWWISVVEDITERKQAEHALQRSAEDLSRSNKDLEQFAYVSSHDLQEPLRMVVGFLQLLESSYGGTLDAAADKYIKYAVDGAKRMQRLIDDLLTYSRIGTGTRKIVLVDSGKMLREALSNLSTSVEQSGAEIITGDLPPVQVDASQLVQVFQNLVGNALKFRGDQRPKVYVSARKDGEYWLFSVKDNGIGIASEFSDKVFLIFQRLHTRDKYPGTGIGLAVCKKIVNRHGGRIWVESTKGEGSTFYFTVPV